MHFKKIVCCLLSCLLLISSVATSMVVLADDYFVFAYNSTYNGYEVTLNSDYLNLNTPSNLIIPEKFNDGTNGELNITFATKLGLLSSDTLINEITYPSGVAFSVSQQFKNFKSLSKITWKSSSLTMAANTFYGCSSTLEGIYIDSLNVSIVANSFRGINTSTSAKIYVASEEIKTQIVNATASGSYPVPASMIEVMQLETPKSSVELSCEKVNITYGTVGGFKPSAKVTVGDNTVANPTVTYQLYTDKACQNKYSGYEYNSSRLPIGTYYLRASVAGTDDYQGSVSNVVEVEVKANVIDESVIADLNKAIEAAKNFKEENVAEDYDSTAWDNVFSTSVSTNALPQAEIVAREIEGGLVTKARVEEVTEALNTALETLKESVINPESEKAELQKVIANADVLISDNNKKYTEDSFTKLKDELTKAEEVFDSNTATKTQVTNATKALQDAIDNLLEVKPEEANDYVNLQGAWKKQGGADNKMSSLKAETKYSLGDWWIEITDLDLSGMINPTLEVTYKANGDTTQISANKSGSTGGTSAWDITITSGKDKSGVSEYSLDKEIKNLFITSNNAGMVYNKIRVFDAETDFTALEEAIKSGEAVNQSKYTEETVKALTAVIEAGKAVRENAKATQVEVDEAVKAINNAIKALEKKPEPTPTKTNPTSPSKPTAPTKVTATTRSASDVAKDKKAAVKAMKQAKITKLKVKSKTKKKINVTWKKVKKAKGYQVQVSTNKKFKKSKIIFNKLTKKKTLKITNKKIKSKKTYYVRVRAYATYKNKNGKAIKVYSKWNKKSRKVIVK